MTTSADLLSLADTITRMAGQCHQTNGANVVSALNQALVCVLDAAKSAAFREAMDRHLAATKATP